MTLGCIDITGDVTNTIQIEVSSPAGNNKIIVFSRDAGATTAPNTQVSIIPSSEVLGPAGGNAFIADCNHGKAPSADWGGPQVNVTWVSDNKVIIRHHSEARIFLAKEYINGVNIEYKSIAN